MRFSVAAAALLLSVPVLSAQTPASAPVTESQAKAPLFTESPLLQLPPEQLKPDSVHTLQTMLADYGELAHYRDDNAALPPAPPGRVVFFGDSITWLWGRDNTGFFPGKPYISRGISGQTTSQMVVRFQQDVVALKPAAVLVLAGTNDLAGNTGIESLTDIENNLRSMADMAEAHHIRFILASVLPVDDYAWRPGLQPAGKVRELNAWAQGYCKQHGCTYLDYYTALATPEGAMKPGTSKDGVHPTAEGYAIMAPLAQAAIDRALARR